MGGGAPAKPGEESITARDQSSCFAGRGFFGRTRCGFSRTPVSFHAARRRRHVVPEPKPSSWGRHSHWVPQCFVTDRNSVGVIPVRWRKKALKTVG
jgi:hypothetical protein